MIDAGYSVQERHDMLEETQWASEFSWEELKNIAFYLSVSKVTQGMDIFKEGSEGNCMYIIVDGRVNIVKEDMEGHGKVVTAVPRGKAFGEMALFDGERRSATVLAAERTTMLVLSKENLHKMMEDYPRLAAKLLFKLGKIISQRLRATTGQLVDLI